jgi:hypothetical protein
MVAALLPSPSESCLCSVSVLTGEGGPQEHEWFHFGRKRVFSADEWTLQHYSSLEERVQILAAATAVLFPNRSARQIVTQTAVN